MKNDKPLARRLGTYLTRDEAIAKAHVSAEKSYHSTSGERRWLIGTVPDSYDNPKYRSELHVLEGSPPKGYVLVLWHGERHGCVVALDWDERKLRRWVWSDKVDVADEASTKGQVND